MNSRIIGFALAIALAAAPAMADTPQLAAAAGLEAEQASALTLSQVAGHFFNAGARASDRQAVGTDGVAGGGSVAQLAAVAGLSAEEAAGLTLSDLAAEAFNAGSRASDRQVLIRRSSRDVTVGADQLAASAGLDPAEARGLSLSEIAAYHFNRGGEAGDAQSVR